MKTLIEGSELLLDVPPCSSTGKSPVVRLPHGLVLDDANCFFAPTLLVGSVGSGKSTIMRSCMDGVFSASRENRDNIVVFCAKPEMLAYAEEGDPILSISTTDPASCWGIFEEMAQSDDPELTLREIADDLFAEAREKTNQIFFPNAARDLFEGTCRYMFRYGRENGIHFSNGDLIEFLQTTPVRSTSSNGTTPDCPGWIELASQFPAYFGAARDYIGKNGSDQGLGVLSELRTLIASSLYGSFAARESRFSAIGSLREGGRHIFLYYDYAKSGNSSLIILKIILDLLLKQAMSADSTHKTWFFMDEFSSLPKSRSLTNALSLGRDPGGNGRGGVRIMAAIQSAQLMTHHYSENEAKCLLSLFPNLVILNAMDAMTRSLLADRYGNAHYLYQTASVGGKPIVFNTMEPVVSDYHFSMIQQPGQAICSLPRISSTPFFYDGYQKGYSI